MVCLGNAWPSTLKPEAEAPLLMWVLCERCSEGLFCAVASPAGWMGLQPSLLWCFGLQLFIPDFQLQPSWALQVLVPLWRPAHCNMIHPSIHPSMLCSLPSAMIRQSCC